MQRECVRGLYCAERVAACALMYVDVGRMVLRVGQLGGNAALIKFFKERGVNELPIRDKYNSSAAELYRER